MAHQSLYRRYRPRRFAELRGQDHIVGALRNAVAHQSEGHAYLFSGPRGTGKTSTARILAKALNCDNLDAGEPCATCESCISIEKGTSYDLFELDAASNNGVDAMRDLVSRTVVGSPGRTKVYILDEVHMLSPAASNALLKTLEEPPEHVVFVLATTDPQKVLPTIRSRTQHFEFSLLSSAELTSYVEWIRSDAGLDIDEAAVAQAVRQGRGSARDTLSALDLIVAAGGVQSSVDAVAEIVAALVSREVAAVMQAVASAVSMGREPRVLAEQLIVVLRDAFLSAVGAELGHLNDADQVQMKALAHNLGAARTTHALEVLGAAMVDMRQSSDPRVPLEVGLIKLCGSGSGASLEELSARVDELERRLASAPSVTRIDASVSSAPAARSDSPVLASERDAPEKASGEADRTAQSAKDPDAGLSGVAAARANLARLQGAPAAADRGNSKAAEPSQAGSQPAPPVPPGARRLSDAAPVPPPTPPSSHSASPEPPMPGVAPTPPSSHSASPEPPMPGVAPTPSTSPVSAGAPAATAPVDFTVEHVSAALHEGRLEGLRPVSKAMFREAIVESISGSEIRLTISAPLRARAEQELSTVESALSKHLGVAVTVVVVDPSSTPRTDAGSRHKTPAQTPAGSSSIASEESVKDSLQDEDEVDLSLLVNAPNVSTAGVDRIVAAFPGATIIEDDK